MDPRRFDRLIKTLSHTGTRRSLVRLLGGLAALPAAGALTSLQGDASGRRVGRARRAQTGAERCIPTGKRCERPPRGTRRGCDRCCQNHVSTVINRKGKERKVCACQPRDLPCRETTECCNGVCLNGSCRNGGAPCTALGLDCTAGATTCCAGAQCAGPLSTEPTCQDCNQAPTPAGAACNNPPGNQCCGGNPECFSALRAQNPSEAVCVSSVNCASQICESDGNCPGGACIVVAFESACCGQTAGNVCATLCGG